MAEHCGCTATRECPKARRFWNDYVARINFARQTDRLRDHEAAEEARKAWAAHREAALGATKEAVGGVA